MWEWMWDEFVQVLLFESIFSVQIVPDGGYAYEYGTICLSYH